MRTTTVLVASAILVVIGFGAYQIGVRQRPPIEKQASVSGTKANSAQGPRRIHPERRLWPSEVQKQPVEIANPDPPAAAEEPEQPVFPRRTALQQRDELVQDLRASGSTSGTDLANSRELESEWTRIASEFNSNVRFGSWQCYRGGCTVTATIRDLDAAEPLFDKLLMSPVTAKLVRGQIFRSGPIQSASGLTEITWIVSHALEVAGAEGAP